MKADLDVQKNCLECGKSITFEDFCRDNPVITEITAKSLWTTSYISIFCPDCFFSCQERPYKQKRGFYRWKKRAIYYNRKLRVKNKFKYK